MEATQITTLLQAHTSGSSDALDSLIPLVYEEMLLMAKRRLMWESPDHTLSPAALVHEAYLKLVNLNRINWQNRSHFFGITSHIMRHILVDHALKKKAEKRGGNRKQLTLHDEYAQKHLNLDDILSIDQALKRLEK